METCFRLHHGVKFFTDISCEGEDATTCCFIHRIFTATINDTTGFTRCRETWPKCLASPEQITATGLSERDKIWLVVLCLLILAVLLITGVIVYKLWKQRKRQMLMKDVGTGSTENMVINIEAEGHNPKLVEAAQIFVTNASRRTTTREREPADLKNNLESLIKEREEEKLEAFLETLDEYYKGQVDQQSVDNAKGILDAWHVEDELRKLCEKLDHLNDWEITSVQSALRKVDESLYSSHVRTLIVNQAKQRVERELHRLNMISSVRLQLTKAMKSNDLEELENLVDLIRAKQLDKEFEKELFYAQGQFEKNSKPEGITTDTVERDLESAIGKRDPHSLKLAIQRAELCDNKSELKSQLNNAKRAMKDLQEIEKLKNLHRLRLKNAMKSADTQRMEKALSNVRLDGFGEELETEISDLETVLKKKYLQKRLKGNLTVAVKNLDLVRLRRAINEVTVAGFLKELGIELEQAQGLLSKLERIELIKKAVLDLTNSHIAEIKSYAAPPIQVHKVLIALLIVLGEDPEVVRDWFEIQVILVKTGKLSLKRRVQEYNPASLTMGNAKRAANIIQGIRAEELQNISKAAKVFYLWTAAVVEDRLSLDVIRIE